MATKPTDLPEWASGMSADIVNPTGAKKLLGWLTAEKPPAQYVNWLFNNIFQWAIWLKAFEDEAHVWSKHQSFNEGITASRTLANNHAVTATGNGTGAGVFARGGASGVGVRAEGMGTTAQGVDAYGDTSGANGGAGVRGTGGSQAPGVVGNGNANAPGVLGTGGNTGGSGVEGVGGNGDGYGVRGTGGSTNGTGVRGVGTGTGRGVEGVGGSSNGIGVQGNGIGNGPGVLGQAGTGAAPPGVKGIGGVGNAGVDGPGVLGLGTGNGEGVRGEGASSGLDGDGVVGKGGTINGRGVTGLGAGSGDGVRGDGGSANGVGVRAIAGGANGTAIVAVATGNGLALNGTGDLATNKRLRVAAQDTGSTTPTPVLPAGFAGIGAMVYGSVYSDSAGGLVRGRNVFDHLRVALGHYRTTFHHPVSVSLAWAHPEASNSFPYLNTSIVGGKLQVDVFFEDRAGSPVDVYYYLGVCSDG